VPDVRPLPIARIGLWLLACLVPAFAASAHDQSYGFVWANEPTAASYTPGSTYAYNDSGRTPRIARTGTGEYRVTFPSLSGLGSTFGNVQVSAYGSTGHYCKIASWSGDDVAVACFDSAGIPADTRYTVLYLVPDYHDNPYAFALAHQPSTLSYAPARSYNAGGGGLVLAIRVGVGRYALSWTGFGATGSGRTHAQVTAYGSGNARCRLDDWIDDSALVSCFDATGTPVDSQYSVLYWRPGASDDGLAFAWASEEVTGSYPPSSCCSYNAGGGTITATRDFPGVYRMTWAGMSGIGTNGGHIQVSAVGPYGGGDSRCKVSSWGPDTAVILCFDAAGSPLDVDYNVLFLKPPKKVWTQEYAYAHADQPTSALYTPDPLGSYHQLEGEIEISRSGPGVYSVHFDRFGAYADGGNVQVNAHGFGNDYCKVASWTSDTVDVRCFDGTGVASDTRFDVMYLKSHSQPTGVAYAWANVPQSASYTPDPDYSYNPAGGAITATRSSPGVYLMQWAGYGSLVGGHPKVTAYGTSNRRCQIGSWATDTVAVRCFDSAGNSADSAYSILYLLPDPNDDGLAFAWANEATSPSYTPSLFYSFNSGDGGVTVESLVPGRYTVTFDGFARRGLGFLYGHAQVSAYGSTDRRCAAGFWGIPPGGSEAVVQVTCHDMSGAVADAQYNVLFLKPVALPEPDAALMLASGAALLAMLARRTRAGRLVPAS
jgi:hypothetical protein